MGSEGSDTDCLDPKSLAAPLLRAPLTPRFGPLGVCGPSNSGIFGGARIRGFANPPPLLCHPAWPTEGKEHEKEP
eukprot:4708501-Alexandrium_andersonii.AAC.1